MRNIVEIGPNKTGEGTSPIDSAALRAQAASVPPNLPGSERDLVALRAAYAAIADPIGTVPPPSTIKGVGTTAFAMLKGHKPTVLIDKLGARLAFERTGVRLYQALLVKLEAYGSWDGGPSQDALEQIIADEFSHFKMLRDVITGIGADPTAQTPAADLEGVTSMGLLQSVTDPRTNLAQCLCAIQTAELTDNAGWELLIQLSDSLGHTALSAPFRQALADEARHLRWVQDWIGTHTLGEAHRRMPVS